VKQQGTWRIAKRPLVFVEGKKSGTDYKKLALQMAGEAIAIMMNVTEDIKVVWQLLSLHVKGI
jgi:hypothetical protein